MYLYIIKYNFLYIYMDIISFNTYFIPVLSAIVILFIILPYSLMYACRQACLARTSKSGGREQIHYKNALLLSLIVSTLSLLVAFFVQNKIPFLWVLVYFVSMTILLHKFKPSVRQLSIIYCGLIIGHIYSGLILVMLHFSMQ